MTEKTADEVMGQKEEPLGRTVQLAEVCVFLFLILPSLILSLFVVQQGTLAFPIAAISTILRDLGLVALILFLLWRNREAVREIGWTVKSAWKEIGLGILLFIVVFFAAGLIEVLLRSLGFTAPSTPLPSALKAEGYLQFVLAFVLVVVVAVAEETIFRGYLILRFRNVTSSTLIAVLLSSFIFALGHGYEGTAGLVTVGLVGLAFALVYIWRKSLVAPIVMHFLEDFLSIVLLPLLGVSGS